VRLNPSKVTVEVPALIVKVEMVTFEVNVGIFVAVETMSALSVEVGTRAGFQFAAVFQLVLVPPHHVNV